MGIPSLLEAPPSFAMSFLVGKSACVNQLVNCRVRLALNMVEQSVSKNIFRYEAARRHEHCNMSDLILIIILNMVVVLGQSLDHIEHYQYIWVNYNDLVDQEEGGWSEEQGDPRAVVVVPAILMTIYERVKLQLPDGSSTEPLWCLQNRTGNYRLSKQMRMYRKNPMPSLQFNSDVTDQ